MRIRSALTVAAAGLVAGLLAGSCAVAPGVEAEEPVSVYGALLAARYAGTVNAADASARFYAEALSREPGSGYISERAFYAALIAGDFERAGQAASRAVANGEEVRLAKLFLSAEGLVGDRELQPPPEEGFGPFSSLVGDMMADWAAVAAGGREAARQRVDPGRDAPAGATGYLLVHQALLFEAAGDADRAEDAYRAADASLDLANYTTLLLGRFLEREGRRDEAAALYRRQIARGAADPEVAAALDRAEGRGRRPRAFTPAEAAARALFPPAALLANASPADHSALYLRLVQRLDPAFDRNTVYLAGVLERLGYQEAARETYRSIDDGPFAPRAALDRAWLSFRMGEDDAAFETARAAVEETGDETALLLLADLNRARGDCAAAAPLYARAIEIRAASGRVPDWRQHYFHAVCLQYSGDWPAAEAALLRALEIAPEEPRVLNHLGYNWIVFGERVAEGFEMVRRAAEQEPDNGAIVDSLGWGHFKQGDYAEAVRHLERAVELSPGDPTINWHLGDAYWRVGREREARFQWERALDLDPEAREVELIRTRLDSGLDAAPPDLE